MNIWIWLWSVLEESADEEKSSDKEESTELPPMSPLEGDEGEVKENS